MSTAEFNGAGDAARSLPNWTARTAVGWFVGFILTVVIATVLEGAGGGGVQTPIGVGMGAGIGLLQSRPARAWLGIERGWARATFFGVLLPFVVWDLAGALGASLPFGLAPCALMGGALAGVLQSRQMEVGAALRRRWVLVSGLGWGLAGLAAGFGETIPRGLVHPWLAAGITLAGMLLGGAIVGLVTAPTLHRIRSVSASVASNIGTA